MKPVGEVLTRPLTNGVRRMIDRPGLLSNPVRMWVGSPVYWAVVNPVREAVKEELKRP